MELYDKSVDRFQDLSKVQNPDVSKAKSNNYLELTKKIFEEIGLCHNDHALSEGFSWYGFTKFLNWFLRSRDHVL